MYNYDFANDTEEFYYYVRSVIYKGRTYIFRSSVAKTFTGEYLLHDYNFVEIKKSNDANTLLARKASTNHTIGHHKDKKVNLLFQTFYENISKTSI